MFIELGRRQIAFSAHSAHKSQGWREMGYGSRDDYSRNQSACQRGYQRVELSNCLRFAIIFPPMTLSKCQLAAYQAWYRRQGVAL